MAWSSHFAYSYSLERPFPFPYFTISTTAILFIVFALSTVYNVATNGYDLETRITTDPNSTLATRPWFLNNFFTFGDRTLHPQCQPMVLPIGTQLTTTNVGFVYILKRVTNQKGVQLTSVSYLNNTLRSCNVTSVNIYLHSWLNSTQLDWWAWNDMFADVISDCYVENEQGLFTITLKTLYMAPQIVYAAPPPPDMMSQASLWWGMQLMQCYWYGIKLLIGHDQAASNGQHPFLFGNILYTTNADMTGDVESMNLFKLGYLLVDAVGARMRPDKDNQTDDIQRFTNTSFRAAPYLNEGLSFARVYYSLVQMDLGQMQRPSLFSDDESLKRALISPGNFNRLSGGQLYNTTTFGTSEHQIIQSENGDERVPLNESYTRLRNVTGPLGTKPATLSLQYSCQIPTKKSTGTILWTTFLATIVLIATAKTFLIFVAEMVLSHRDPTAFYCACCTAKTEASGDLTEMKPVAKVLSDESGRTPEG